MNNMAYNFIPYGRQNITESDINSVIKILKSDFLTQGPNIDLFEKCISNKVGSKFSIAVNSATSALHLACLAIGLKEKDWLWTSPITFVASANCGRYCGANIDFVDIDPQSGLICIKALKRKLEIAKINKTLPKVLIPVHLSGCSCNMKEIYNLAKEYKFRIIEDASHAIGGKYINKTVGSCEYSDICVFSFHPVKIITTGEGGVATTNNQDLYEQIKNLRSHGIIKDKDKFIESNKAPWIYEQQSLGYNYRMTDFQSALGISQLSRLDFIVKKRNKILSNYKNLFSDLEIDFLKIPENITSSVHLAIILIRNKSKTSHENIFKSLRKAGIGVQLHYSPVHLQPYYKIMGFKYGDFPNAEKYAESAITIPLFPELKEDEMDYIYRNLKASILKN